MQIVADLTDSFRQTIHNDKSSEYQRYEDREFRIRSKQKLA